MLLLVLLWLRCSGSGHSCAKKNKSGGAGDYGRASIDSNLQYGEGKEEYYQYQNEKKQTRLVDENEMYGEYVQD